MVTLEDLRGDSPIYNESAKNKDEVLTLQTQRMLKNFIEFKAKKARERRLLEKQRKKPKVLSSKRNKKPDAFTVKTVPISKRCFSEINKNEEQPKGVFSKKKPKRVKRQSKRQRGLELMVPDMPIEFKDKITELDGSDVKLVIQKELFPTDLSSHQDRLAIPRGQIKAEFLTEEEQVKLDEKEEDGKHYKGMVVQLIEPSLQNSSIKLKIWKLGHSNSYVLSSPWKTVADRNKLISGDILQLWSFRVNLKLHFALVRLAIRSGSIHFDT